LSLLCSPCRPPPTSTLFPYTTLFRSFRAGALRGLAVVFLHSLVIPNMATWVLFPSMGACIGARGGGTALCALSYTNFPGGGRATDRKSTRLNSSHVKISYAVFCLKKK